VWPRTRTCTLATDYTPYEGRQLAGWSSTVIIGGRVVLDANRSHDLGPVGRVLHAAELPEQLLT